MVTAAELLQKMRNADFEVTVTGDALQVLPARWIDDELAALIRTHKTELINLLKNEAQPIAKPPHSAKHILRNLNK